MRRSERITLWAGGVLVPAAIALAGVALVAQGSRVAPELRPRPPVPAELAWMVYLHCSLEADPTLTLYDAFVDTCLAAYPTEDPAEIDYSGESIDADAERLLAYDVAVRWLQPCLAGHGIRQSVVAGVRDYLGEQRWPWNDLYGFPVGDIDFDAFLRARVECGPGHQPFGP